MSTLSVDTIQGKTTAGTVAMPAGTIIQVVTAVDDDTQSITSTSLVDTGLTLDITPKFQNSKMQIFANMYEVFAQSASSSGRSYRSLLAASPGSILFLIPSRPAISRAEKQRYGFEEGSGKRATTLLAFGDSVQGIRTQPDLFLAE